jgi:DNA-binding helix-hairpin-helix protein with protein kinase domain
MANALYDKARKAFADGDIDLLNDTIKVVLIDAADYTVNLADHDFLNDVPSGARVGTPQTLGNKDRKSVV